MYDFLTKVLELSKICQIPQDDAFWIIQQIMSTIKLDAGKREKYATNKCKTGGKSLNL